MILVVYNTCVSINAKRDFATTLACGVWILGDLESRSSDARFIVDGRSLQERC